MKKSLKLLEKEKEKEADDDELLKKKMKRIHP